MGGEEEMKAATRCSEHWGPGRAQFKEEGRGGIGEMEGSREKEREVDAQGLGWWKERHSWGHTRGVGFIGAWGERLETEALLPTPYLQPFVLILCSHLGVSGHPGPAECWLQGCNFEPPGRAHEGV